MFLAEIKDLGTVLTAIGLFLTYKALKSTHDWNRRSYAAKVISEWNNRIRPVTNEIEKILPQVLDVQNGLTTPKQITQDEADAIYFCKDVKNSNYVLKSNFIALLNELEQIASAYHNSVADRMMIEQSFKNTFVRWGLVLENFVTIYCEKRNYPEPWGAYHHVFNQWKNRPIIPPRPRADSFFGNLFNYR